MRKVFEEVYRMEEEFFVDIDSRSFGEYGVRKVSYYRPKEFDLEAVGIELGGQLVYGILREKTGDEREFLDLENGGRVLEIEDPEAFLDGYDDFVDRYISLVQMSNGELQEENRLEDSYPRGGYGWTD